MLKYSNIVREGCVSSLKDALAAEQSGADRIEFCDRLDLDGTSPQISVIEKVLQHVSIPVKVIVNPNPYNYCYSEHDLQEIIAYKTRIQGLPIAGIVFGCLTKEGNVDYATLGKVAQSTPLPITFHKAIDLVDDYLIEVEQLIKSGMISSILTSGGSPTAWEGRSNLIQVKEINDQCNEPVELIAAGSITEQNLLNLHTEINYKSYHGKRIVNISQ